MNEETTADIKEQVQAVENKPVAFMINTKDEARAEARNISLFILGVCTGLLQKTNPEIRFIVKDLLKKRLKKLMETL